MSIAFSDTSTYKGLVQQFEKEIGANYGDVSANAIRLKEFTVNANIALDDFFNLALSASGSWQLDDSNQTDYPIITTSLVSGQRDYSFTTDGSGNLILDIYRVFVLTSETGTTYYEVFPIDQQTDDNVNTQGFTNGLNRTGPPFWYDKTGNGIFLDPIPGYSVAAGLKIYINREPSYFTSADTTKKPGVPGLFHKYFYLKPALEYARRNNLSNFSKIQEAVYEMEGVPGTTKGGSIQKYFGSRAKDERQIITSTQIRHR